MTPATLNSIAITATNNAIQNTYCQYENRQITVRANAGLATQVETTFLYRLANLAGSP